MRSLLCLVLGLAAAFSRPVAGACTDADPVLLLDHAERAVLQGRLDDYPTLALEVDAALSCGQRASPKLVARALLIQGAWQHFSGQTEGVPLSFATAARLSPGAWNPDFGAELRELFDEAAANPPPGMGTVAVDPALEDGVVALVDGLEASLPASAPVGFHLLQLVEEDGKALHAARFVLLDPGEQVSLSVGPLQPGGDELASRRPRPKWPLLAAGGAALLGGTAAALAVRQRGTMQAAGTTDALETAYGQQRLYAVSAWTLGGLAVAGAGAWFAF